MTTFNKFLLVLLLFTPFLSSANITGTDLQNFNPTSNGLDFVTVYSSDTLEPGTLNFGAFATYTTNTMPFFLVGPAPTTQKFAEPNDQSLSSDLHLGFGLMRGWDFGVSANYILDQQVDNSAFLGTFSKTGLTDLRVNTKIRLHKGKTSGLAGIVSMDFDRVGNNPFSGQDPGPNINIDLAYDKKLGPRWRWGINLGYRLRDEGEAFTTSGVTPVPDQITYSTALSYLVEKWKSNFIFELYGSSPTDDVITPTDRDGTNLEALLGWRWNVHKRFDFHMGVGTEAYHGLATPDIRGYIGFNWRLGPLWNSDPDDDKDGVPNSKDRCPQTLERDRENVNAWGCADSDGDGVYNHIDQCPKTEKGARVDDRGCVIEEVVDNDLDKDGVPNDIDQCPNTPPGTEVDDLGCDRKRVKNITLENLNFITGTATMVRESKSKFADTINQLSEIKDTIEKIVVEGHTDSTGSASTNRKLSQHRAETVAKLLQENLGFDDNSILAVGHGEDKPIADNSTREGRLKNRRVELRLIRKN